MERNDTVNAIQSYGKNIFRALHYRFGFDFEKPFCTFRIDGVFMKRNIHSFMHTHGYKNNANCVLLMDMHDGKQIRAVELGDYGFSTSTRNYLKGDNSWGYFRTNREFEDARKSGKATTYVIVQDWESRKCPKYDAFDRFGRVKLLGNGDYSHRKLDEVEICQYKLMDMAGRVFEPSCIWGDTVGETIDGSGYIKEAYRNDLRDRLRFYKAKKARDAFSADKLVELDRLIAERKFELVNMFIAAGDDPYKLDHFADALSGINGDGWKGFRGACRDAKWFKEYLAKGNHYTSLEEVEKAYATILKKLKG